MTSEADRTVLSRPIKVDEIKDGTRGETAATAAEMNEIARLLELVALNRLDLSYRLDHRGPGRVHLTRPPAGRCHPNLRGHARPG